MSQTRLESFIETMFNVVIGFSLNYVLNIFLIPLFADDGHGHAAHLSAAANWWMGCAYTVISVARSYTLRRWFNAGIHKTALAFARYLKAVGVAIGVTLDAVTYWLMPLSNKEFQ